MSPRTGRRKAEHPKEVRYSIRLDVQTEQRLRDFCEKKGISKGEAIRQGIELLLTEKNKASDH